MMNFKKLNEIKIEDLKNVDYPALWKHLKSQPDRIVLTVVISTTVIFLLFYFSKRPREIRAFDTKIQMLEEKIAAIEKYQARKEELEIFSKNIPDKITADALRKLINDLAVKNNVSLKSFSQAQKQDHDFFQTISFQIDASADEYRNIVLFVRDLENSSFAIRLNSWQGRMTTHHSAPRPGREKQTDNQLTVVLNVSAVNFKNENVKN